MTLSLNFIVAFLVAIIAIIVATTCVVLSLVTSLDQIDTVGQNWASELANGVAAKTTDFIIRAEDALLSAGDYSKTFAPAYPQDMSTNWTTAWVPYFQKEGVKFNYEFSSFTILFEGEETYWMFTSTSDENNQAAKIEWFETPDPAQPTVQASGGIRFWLANSTLWPYADGTTESARFNVFTRPQKAPSFNNVRAPLRNLKTASGDLTKSQCLWLSPQFAYYPAKNIFWEQFGACTVDNASGTTVGHVLISLGLDAKFTDILRDSPRSKNGEIFILDKDGYLLATTTEVPFFTVRTISSVTFDVAGNGCGNTDSQPLLNPPRQGCRFPFTNYSGFAPLGALTNDFALSANVSTLQLNSGGKDYLVVSRRFESNRGLRFNLVTFTPKDDLKEGVDSGVAMAIGIACGIVVIAVIATIIVTVYTLGPLVDLAEKMRRTSELEGLDKEDTLQEEGDDDRSSAASNKNKNNNNNGDEEEDVSGTLKLESASAISEIANLEIAYAFSHNSLVNFVRYVSKTIVKKVIMNTSKGTSLYKMDQTTVTSFFADIESFTRICEKVEAHNLSKLLHGYFKKMTRLVLAHGGIVEKLIGDCINAIWNAPFPIFRHELLASLCALAIQREANRNPLKKNFLDAGFNLAVRIGVATGTALAGNIGSSQRITYTALGEPVATANSLEPYNKKWDTLVMVDENIARECNDELLLRLLTRAKVSGRAHPVMCYHLMGTQPDAVLRRKGNYGGGGASGMLALSANSGGKGSGSSGEDNTNNELELDVHNGSSLVMGRSPLTPNTPGSTISDTETVETDTLSTNSSNNSGGLDEFLPENINLETLLSWHRKRTSVEDNVVAFCHQFNEASRCLIDHDYTGAKKKLTQLEEDDWLPLVWKTHKSVSILKNLIEKAENNDPSVSTKQKPIVQHGVKKLGSDENDSFFVMAE